MRKEERGEGGAMRGEGQSRNEGTIESMDEMEQSDVKYLFNSTRHKVCYSFNSRGSVIIELLYKAGGTLQTVSGGGTSTPLTGGSTRQTEATARLKILYTQ